MKHDLENHYVFIINKHIQIMYNKSENNISTIPMNIKIQYQQDQISLFNVVSEIHCLIVFLYLDNTYMYLIIFCI